MLAVLLAAGAVTSPAACPVEQARYALRAEPSVSAEFHPTARSEAWPSGLALAIHVTKTRHDYWWLPWNGGTDDMRHVRLTRDRTKQPAVRRSAWLGALRPGVDLDFWTVDEHYDFIEGVPKAGDIAPGHLLLPQLGRVLYYGTVHSGRADSVPRSFFDLVDCGVPNAPADVELLPVA